jgi:hypothetical protein
MKTGTRTLSLCVSLVCALFMIATTLGSYSIAAAGGCETPTPGDIGITVNPNAPGTKVDGPLSLAYDVIGEDATCDTGVRTAVIAVLNLEKGNALATFSAKAPSICLGDVASQKNLIQNLISSSVMTSFFGAPIPFDATCAPGTWCVKSLTNIIPSATSDLSQRAWSMDIELAVRK